MSNKEIAKTETTALAPAPKNYITAVLEATKDQFLAANAGMDLDYVRIGEHLKMNKKGQFVLRSDENMVFGDSIDVVVAMGEQRYMLWGKDGSPEKGELIVAEKTREEAEKLLVSFLTIKPEAAERYTLNDIQLRYLAYVVPTNTLKPEEVPEVYLVSFAQSDTYGFGNYAKEIFRGNKDKGIKKGSGVNTVITRFTTAERATKDGNSYLGIDFSVVGPFNPEDFGIKQ